MRIFFYHRYWHNLFGWYFYLYKANYLYQILLLSEYSLNTLYKKVKTLESIRRKKVFFYLMPSGDEVYFGCFWFLKGTEYNLKSKLKSKPFCNIFYLCNILIYTTIYAVCCNTCFVIKLDHCACVWDPRLGTTWLAFSHATHRLIHAQKHTHMQNPLLH